MNNTNVRYTIMDEMEKAGIAKREASTLIREFSGRTYLVALAIFDVTDYDKEGGR